MDDGKSGAEPRHGQDPYGTPPYGRPGPWAPAPPVQHPGRMTPPEGTPTPGQPPSGQPPAGPPPPSGHPGGGAQPPAGPPPSGPQPPPGQQAPAGPPPQPAHPAGPTPAHGTELPPIPPGGHTPGTAAGMRYDPWAAAPPAQHPAAPGPRAAAPARPRALGLIAAALAIALVAGGVGGAVGVYLERSGTFSRVTLDQVTNDDRTTEPGTVAAIAEAALPGVVTLHVQGGGSGGTGTGFVLDTAGHVLTNAHVVRPARDGGRIQVTFSSGDAVQAELIGSDAGYDLAVVKVTGVSGLTPLPLGDSDAVRVGDPVVAIGSPFDLEGTVTSGIISATDRPITAGGDSDVSYVNALQTDAPINPGNSGGPLVDTGGRVIGINSAIRTPDGRTDESGQRGSVGLGFAIPVNQAKRIAEELINDGRATHPVLGVRLDMAYSGSGARVGGSAGESGVLTDGPADAAGVRDGDVIVAVNGSRVRTSDELIVKVRSHRPGDVLELTIERDGAELTIDVELGSSAGE